MAIEAIAAVAVKEVVAKIAAEEATKQLAEKIATQSIETKSIEQMQTLDQLNRMESFRLGEGVASDEKLKLREENAEDELRSKINDNEESKFYSTKLERLNQTPTENVEWPSGERGVGECVPKDGEMKEELAKFGQNSVFYKEDHTPEFSPFSRANVEIDNMSVNRDGPRGNYEQADEKLAEQFNAEKFGGRDNWEGSDVRDWRRQDLTNETGEKWSWHEEPDRKTCRLIPTKINDFFKHLGGVGECKRRDAAILNNNGVKFDA